MSHHRRSALRAALIAGALGGGLLVPGGASATPINQTPPTVQSGYSGGPPQPGVMMFCNPGTWGSSDGGTPLVSAEAWYEDNTSGSPVSTGGNYTPVQGQIGHTFICVVTERDSDGGTLTVDSAAAAPTSPFPSIQVTEDSAQISGNAGEDVAGVRVSLELVRGGLDVASATATTSGAGAWTAALSLGGNGGSPIGVTGGDTLDVSYAAPAGQTTTVPATSSYGPLAYELFNVTANILSDGSMVNTPSEGGCGNQGLLVNGVAETFTQQGEECAYSPINPLTAQDDVEGTDSVTTPSAPDGSESTLEGIAPAGLPGATGGAPICSADLVSDLVTCTNLASAAYAVRVNGGAMVALKSNGPGQGSVAVSGLQAGDVITLDETSPVTTARHLATLHVSTLRTQVTVTPGSDTTADTCAPGHALGDTSASFSAFAVCALTGSSTDGFDAELDDLGGGATTVSPPTLGDEIPSSGGSLPSNFTAYADWTGAGATDQELADVSSVQLTVTPRGSATPVIIRDLTLTSDGLGPYGTASVSGLTPGAYSANWALTDTHGDTYGYQAPFVVQEGATGPQGTPGVTGAVGATGAAGAQGPAGANGAPGATGATGAAGTAGRNGVSSELKCVTKAVGSGRHRRNRESCTVIVLAPGSQAASITLSHGGKVVANARSLVRRDVARVRLDLNGRHQSGRYVLTVTVRRGGRTVTDRWRETIR